MCHLAKIFVAVSQFFRKMSFFSKAVWINFSTPADRSSQFFGFRSFSSSPRACKIWSDSKISMYFGRWRYGRCEKCSLVAKMKYWGITFGRWQKSVLVAATKMKFSKIAFGRCDQEFFFENCFWSPLKMTFGRSDHDKILKDYIWPLAKMHYSRSDQDEISEICSMSLMKNNVCSATKFSAVKR